jgi:hypothetical protein
MRSLKLLILFIICLLLGWIFFINPARVDLYLPGLPLLEGRVGFFLVIAFLLGLVPSMVSHRISRFFWRRRLTKARTLTGHAVPDAPSMQTQADSEAALLARARAAGGAAG